MSLKPIDILDAKYAIAESFSRIYEELDPRDVVIDPDKQTITVQGSPREGGFQHHWRREQLTMQMELFSNGFNRAYILNHEVERDNQFNDPTVGNLSWLGNAPDNYEVRTLRFSAFEEIVKAYARIERKRFAAEEQRHVATDDAPALQALIGVSLPEDSLKSLGGSPISIINDMARMVKDSRFNDAAVNGLGKLGIEKSLADILSKDVAWVVDSLQYGECNAAMITPTREAVFANLAEVLSATQSALRASGNMAMAERARNLSTGLRRGFEQLGLNPDLFGYGRTPE